MTFSVDNLKKPSNPQWKSIADFFLYSLPLYLGVILALPISDNLKIYINAGLTLVIITLKGLTKFTAKEEEPQG